MLITDHAGELRKVRTARAPATKVPDPDRGNELTDRRLTKDDKALLGKLPTPSGTLLDAHKARVKAGKELGDLEKERAFLETQVPVATTPADAVRARNLWIRTVNALVAATHLMIPVQSSYFALEGTDDLLETVEKIRSRPNPNLKLLGAVITLHDKRTTLSKDVRKAIAEVFGNRVFRTTITKSIRLEESPAHKESIFTFAPQSTGAYEYYRLCEEVIERV